jgi:DNA-directed RNA polymerase subunit RPC12/RpoP
MKLGAPRSSPRSRPEIAFPCPRCGQEAVAGLDGSGRCQSCGEEAPLSLSPELRESRVVEACPACGSSLLYVQRDFNQKAGLAVVAVGAVLAPFTPYYSSLMAAALIDAILYALLPEITVCYRCHAHFRGFARNPRHQAFDLHVAEQYDVHPPSGS